MSDPTPRTDALYSSLAHKMDLDYLDIEISAFDQMADHARGLEREITAAHKALMTCDGAMMGKVKPSSPAFKAVNRILRPWMAESNGHNS